MAVSLCGGHRDRRGSERWHGRRLLLGALETGRWFSWPASAGQVDDEDEPDSMLVCASCVVRLAVYSANASMMLDMASMMASMDSFAEARHVCGWDAWRGIVTCQGLADEK